MHPYFEKRFDAFGLGRVAYESCSSCGFVASPTLHDMPEDDWARLNMAFHDDCFGRTDNPYDRNQRHFNQALLLYLCERHRIVQAGRWLDWGSGQGRLAAQLRGNFGLVMANYDVHARGGGDLDAADLEPRAFDLVVSTAVFEHLRKREDLDHFESLSKGMVAVHTLVRGEIPRDPDWMYLLPVHCSFFTNRSMSLLMDQWGYRSSAYGEHAKMWLLSRGDLAPEVEALNTALGWRYLHCKAGFMDFWP